MNILKSKFKIIFSAEEFENFVESLDLIGDNYVTVTSFLNLIKNQIPPNL